MKKTGLFATLLTLSSFGVVISDIMGYNPMKGYDVTVLANMQIALVEEIAVGLLDEDKETELSQA